MFSTVVQKSAPVVLLVEDEDTVLRFIRKVLEPEGYRVLTATNSVEALRIAAQHPGPIDVLLTDVRMREFQDGLELAECINILRPETSVLLISGSPLPAEVRREEKGWEMLSKPFSPDQLKRTVGTLAGAGAGRADWLSVPAA